MAGFVAPESPISEPNNQPKFVAPEAPVSTGLGEIAKQAGKAALFPLSAPAKPAQAVAESFIAPEKPISDPEKPTAPGEFGNMTNYPNDLHTSLSPTLDAFSAPFMVKDLATLGVKGVAALSEKAAAKKAFLEASDEIARMPAQAELLPPMESSIKPTMGLERLKTARKDPLTGEVTIGHNSSEVVKQQLAIQKQALAKMQVDYQDWLRTAKPGDTFDIGDGSKAVMKGQQEVGGGKFEPMVDVFGEHLPPEHPSKSTLMGSNIIDENMLRPATTPEETLLRENHIRSKGFVDAKGQFIAPEEAVSRISDQGSEAGPAFARELPFASSKSGKVPEAIPSKVPNAIDFSRKDIKDINRETGMQLPVPASQQKFSQSAKDGLGRIETGKPTEPFSVPKPTPALPEGGKERIAALANAGGTDIKPYHPFSTSSEIVTDTGKAKNIVRDQLQSGLKAEAQAEHKANTVFKDIQDKYGFKPESLDSQVLSKYMRNPNKAEAAASLKTHIGEEEANKFINAEKDMRAHFDRWRNEVNGVRRQQGLPEVPYKEDYLPQIHEANTLNMLGTPELIGTPKGEEIMKALTTDAEKLKSTKFMHLDEIAFKHLQKQGKPDVEDAIKGMETYGRESERLVALQPHINELRATADSLKDSMPNLAKEYIERADHIAGKQQAIDIALKDTFGPDKFQFFVDATNRMKSNLIQGNPSVPASQLLVLPSVTASIPVRDTLAASVKLVAQPEFRRFLIANSPTLQLRLEGQAAQGLHASTFSNLLSAPSEMVDQATLLYGLAGKYIEGVKEGLSSAEAMKQAEQFASLTQATLSKLATAPVLRSKTAQSAAPFMNQVLTQGRYVTKQMLRGQTLGEKAKTSAKFITAGIAIAQVEKLLQGKKPHSPFEASQYVPMGPAIAQGIGGPVIGGAGRVLKAGSVEDALWQTFRNVMLYQKKIPAGLMVEKGVEKLLRSRHNRKGD